MYIAIWGVFVIAALVKCASQRAEIYQNKWAVLIKDGMQQADTIAKTYGFRNLGPIGSLQNYYLFEHQRVRKRSVLPSIQNFKLERHPSVQWMEQQTVKRRVKRDLDHASNQVSGRWDAQFVDPLWPKQWYLRSGAEGGFDMNVFGAWKKGFTGRGIVVTILDDGIEHLHPDLEQNYDKLASLDINGNDDDPTPSYDANDENKHGTRCAGEVAAVANNSECSVGIAYNAKIGGVRMLDGDVSDAVESIALSLNPNHIDIYSASWGPDDDGRVVDGPGHLAKESFHNGIVHGRQGRGSIFVWASGNGGSAHDACSCDGYTNSVFTLSVSSASEHGTKPWYLEECASTLATTYSSGENYRDRKIATTDIRKRCTESHTGTSASAPLAAAIVALALEANPFLTWRDVQHIVLLTSRTEPLVDADWVINGLGRKASHKYGYGLMDATAMVELAEKWVTVPPQRVCHTDIVVLNANLGELSSSFELTTNACDKAPESVRYLEHVQAVVTVHYSRRGDLQLHLVSPSGTRSTILPRRKNDDDERQGFIDWPFLSVFCWGEDPRGTWTLIVENTGSPSNKGTLVKWQLVMYGTYEYPYTYDGAPTPPVTFTSVESVTEPAVTDDVDITAASLVTISPELCSPLCAPPSGCTGPGPQHCVTCRHLQIATTRLCVESCPEASFMDATGTLCHPCVSPCQRCNNDTGVVVCTKCDAGFRLLTSRPVCLADCASSYYFDTVTEECLPCDIHCQTCVQSADLCTSCHSGHELVDRSHCYPTCPPQHYRDREKRCHPCHSSCVACSGPMSTDCTVCVDELPMENGVCVPQCSDGFYVEYLSAGRKYCLRCHPHCRTCFGGTDDMCLSCSEGRKLQRSTCLRACNEGHLELPTGECITCHPTCALCLGPSETECRTCANNWALLDGVCIDRCPYGYYGDQTVDTTHDQVVCVECHPLCEMCVGPSISQCTLCAPDRQLVNGICLSSCRKGEYRDDTGVCVACDEKCGSCKGPGSDNCTSCESHQFLHHHTCVHACPSGTYVATDQQSMTARCLQCADPSCAQCSPINPVICTECPEDYVLRQDVCVYDNISSTTTEPDIESGICHPGHYWSAVDEECHRCSSHCVQCHGSHRCQQCDLDYRLYSIHDDHRICQPCCLSLIDADIGSCCDCDNNLDLEGDCILVTGSTSSLPEINEPMTSESAAVTEVIIAEPEEDAGLTTEDAGLTTEVAGNDAEEDIDEEVEISTLAIDQLPLSSTLATTPIIVIEPPSPQTTSTTDSAFSSSQSTSTSPLPQSASTPHSTSTATAVADNGMLFDGTSLLVLRIDMRVIIIGCVITGGVILLTITIVAVMLRRKARGHPCCCSDYERVPTAIYVNGREEVVMSTAKYPPTYTVISTTDCVT